MTLWIVLGSIVVLVAVGLFVSAALDGYVLDGLGEAVGALFFGSLIALLLGIFGVVALSPLVGYDSIMRQEKLVALTDERTSLGGSFFLGTGTINEKATYTFYSVEPNGARRLHQEDAYDIAVFEDTDDPYVVIEDGCVSHHPALVECVPRGPTIREIHVPKGSIKTGIKMGVAK